MERYANKSGNSGVLAFEIGSDYIGVQFHGSSRIYIYSYYGGAGQSHVDKLKSLARNGSGLNSYIKKHVNRLYDR